MAQTVLLLLAVGVTIYAFVDCLRTGADELMVTSQIFDPAARIRSYELLMDAVR